VRVFISHSTTDRWISRKIADDIEALGAETFLDAKDIETGDDFDETVRQKLIDSHEILIIVSPLALKSHWVMMEVGAARTLGKRCVPILLCVSPNELPTPINRHLARDINEIERYYEELSRRVAAIDSNQPGAAITGSDSIVAAPPPPGDVRGLNIGDRVKISKRPLEPDSWPVFNDPMRQYLGLTSKIMNVADSPPGYDKAFLLDIDDQHFFWAERWLMPLEAEEDSQALIP
jgi:TIR domain